VSKSGRRLNAETQRVRDAEGGEVSAWKETEIGFLPAEWEVVELGKVAHINLGQSPPSSTYNTEGDGLPFLQGKSTFGRVFPTPERWCSAPKRIAEPGSVLISVRAPVGDVNIAQDEYCIGRGLTALNGGTALDNWFLFYTLISSEPRLESKSTGSTFKSISKGILQNFPIALPCLAEQRRIASALRTIQEAIAAQEDVIVAARELKRSLTERVFTYGPGAEPAPTKQSEIGEIPEHWELAGLDRICSKTVDCPHSTPQYTDAGPVVVRNFNLRDGHLDLEDISYTSETEYEERTSRAVPTEGDVLFSREAPIGEAALVPSGIRHCLGQRMMLLRPDRTQADGKFLVYSLYSANLQAVMMTLGKGVTAKHLNVSDVRRLKIPLPSLTEQSRVSYQLAAVDLKILAEEQRKAALEELFCSALEQLMTGKTRIS
jgi:type I restriction enzyme S subunit